MWAYVRTLYFWVRRVVFSMIKSWMMNTKTKRFCREISSGTKHGDFNACRISSRFDCMPMFRFFWTVLFKDFIYLFVALCILQYSGCDFVKIWFSKMVGIVFEIWLQFGYIDYIMDEYNLCDYDFVEIQLKIGKL